MSITCDGIKTDDENNESMHNGIDMSSRGEGTEYGLSDKVKHNTLKMVWPHRKSVRK